MDVDNSSPRIFEDPSVHPSTFSNVEDWCGIPVVTDTRLAVGVVLTASIVEDPQRGTVVTGYVLTNAGRESDG